MKPGREDRQFLPRDDFRGDELTVCLGELTRNIRAISDRARHDLHHLLAMHVHRDLVLEIFLQVVRIALLVHGRVREAQSISLRPHDRLRHQPPEDVRKAKAHASGKIEERKEFSAPGGVLAVEGRHDAFRQRDWCPCCERHRLPMREPVKRVDIRVAIGQALPHAHAAGSRRVVDLDRTAVVDQPQWQTPRPDPAGREQAVDIHEPGRPCDDVAGDLEVRKRPLRLGDVVVVGIDDDIDVAHGCQQISDHLPRVVVAGEELDDSESERFLLRQADEHRSRAVPLSGRFRIAHHEHVSRRPAGVRRDGRRGRIYRGDDDAVPHGAVSHCDSLIGCR